MNLDTYRSRRRRLLQAWNGGIAILPTNEVKARNADSEFPFRPDSDFLYLTGFEEPESILVLCPGRDEGEVLLFLRPRDPERETWDGRRLGVERAPEVLGVDQAFPRERFEEMLPELLAGRPRLHYRLGLRHSLDRSVIGAVHRLRFKPKERYGAPASVCDPGEEVHEMRLFKDADELATMRQAAEITAEGHREAVRAATAGAFEYQAQAAMEGCFRRRGAVGPAYGSIVAAGANATILHYVENSSRLQGDELLLIDAGAELHYYAADITRTYPVSGQFSPPQQQVYELVLEAQRAQIEEVRVGRPYDAFHEVGLHRLVEGMREWGWLSGSLDEILESGSYRRFFMHKSGHWLGLDVHDAGRYFEQGMQHRSLQPGMVLTVEPGLYVGPDDETVPAEFRGIGVRIEDDILVSEQGPEIMTPHIPKDVAALQDWVAEARAG